MFASELINQGVDLALIGMSTVFAFLTFLVIGTSVMSALVQRYGPEDTRPALTRPGRPAEEDAEVVAAIAAALRVHRSLR